ncbi:pyridoxamine 5'-phosphate oxidase [Candidatus Marsarchaeota G2 archaeon ECH_B_SAG-G16]|jgi:Predicted flavin-nucleotide-binding protein|uniref:Pyridoxamine 5'-phosphate oxidase n=4 Tax=Candidatus Marsarchaeota TaxID=1978152 RepID=A0A2R6AFG5_9ARCH|nr:MAG: pyridoxamine 5'-phosphate oxidase [Candidatus Marsarchaeota G1 archaeon OSP_D]PSN85068.1 MAG: pyridoxamine 5'-phosphate oxidase [Candidatus Marsarchaeota G1 archaeon BE_D]PSN87483.1 MAG: pyridoxamine 5'-phosphate oxidase [Candidatus Marsarchaeota G1 archaeon OSP_C]PSO03784.1 MAG: pyridoxamine 5'-phosphate oxidase [Candidatus Marsarchaeota G2 archaeon ECH_B_SAG-G16]
MFTQKELDFLKRHEVCAFATCVNNVPHVTPVCYIFLDRFFWIAIDYDTKKYKNIKNNKRVALTVFEYRPSRGIMVEGFAEVVEEGNEFREIYQRFYEKFEWVRRDPWKEKEAPFIKVKPEKKASWLM